MGTTGYHYDPIVPAQRHVRQRVDVNYAVEHQDSPLPATRPTCNKKSLCSITPKSKAVPKPKKATFLRVEDPFSKRCTSSICGGGCEGKEKEQNASGQNGKGDEEHENAQLDLSQEEEYNGFDVLRCKDFGASPDKLRENLDAALWTLSDMFRQYPTLPANPVNAMEHMEQARDDATALLLPRKHCAFKDCDWDGSDEVALVQHIHENHLAALTPGMEAFKALKLVYRQDEATLALSIYNEGIATAVRQGAPLASYSIDRRCMLQYNTHLKHENTGASVCFVCACRFPRVHGAKHNPIKFFPLLSKTTANVLPDGTTNMKKPKDDVVFLNGFSKQKTEQMFGLKSYCEKYGRMNEDVTLSMQNAEFDDWHLFVPFQAEDVKVLCCPEDIQCCARDSSSRSHAANVSCVKCRAPICEDCAKCVYASEPSLPPAGLSNDMMIYYAPSI